MKILLCLFFIISLSLIFCENEPIIFTNLNLFDDYYEESVDPISNSLGRTNLLNSSNATALFSNPSALGELESRMISTGMKLYKSTLTRKSEHLSSGEYQHEHRFNNMNYLDPLAVIFPLKLHNYNIGIGIGKRILYDYNLQRKESQEDYMIDEYFSGHIKVYTLAIGYKFSEKISMGMNYSISAKDQVKFHYSYWEGYKKDYCQTPNLYQLYYNLMYERNDKILISASLRPPHSIEYKSEYHWRRYGYYDFDNYYNFTVYYPFQYTLGIKYKINKKSEVSLEYKNKSFSKIKTKDGNLYTTTANGIIKSGINNGNEFNLGYSLNTKLPIRLGYYSSSVPLYDFNYIDPQTMQMSDQPKRKSGFTYGTTLHFNKIQIDISGDHSSITHKDYNLHYNNDMYYYDYFYTDKRDFSINEYKMSITYPF